MKILIKYLSIFGFILLILLLIRVDFSLMLSMIKKINSIFIFIALLLIVIELFFRVLKWNILINIFKKEYSFRDSIKTYLIGFSFGSVTPAKTGDLIKISDLKKRTNLDIKQCISLSIFDRIVDFFLLLFLNLIAITLVIIIFSNIDLFFPILAALLASLFGIIFMLTSYSKVVLKPLFNLLVPKKFKKNVREMFYSFREVVTSARKKPAFYFYVIITLFAWISALIIPYLFSLSLGLNVPMLYFLLFIPIVSFVEILPISILGIGSRDITLVLLFSMIGITKESMLIISWLILLLDILPKVISGFLISWFKVKRPGR